MANVIEVSLKAQALLAGSALAAGAWANSTKSVSISTWEKDGKNTTGGNQIGCWLTDVEGARKWANLSEIIVKLGKVTDNCPILIKDSADADKAKISLDTDYRLSLKFGAKNLESVELVVSAPIPETSPKTKKK